MTSLRWALLDLIFVVAVFAILQLPPLRLGHWYLHQEAWQGAQFSFYLSNRVQFSL